MCFDHEVLWQVERQHISNAKAQIYNKNFLLDKNGVIVAKDITPSQLSSYLN